MLDAAAWERFWSEWPLPWQTLLQAARRAVLADPKAAAADMLACPLLAPCAVEEETEDSDPEEHKCMLCGFVSSSAAGVNCHMAKAHPGRSGSDSAHMKKFVGSSVCPCCGVDFRTRLRAVQHLRHRGDSNNGCRDVSLGGKAPMLGDEVVAELALGDRRHPHACLRAGIHVLAAGGRRSKL